MNNQKHRYQLTIKGARECNLKNISLTIPKNKLIVFTGVSGSGKTSLAFNTIYNEGKRRYMESLSSYARQFLGNSTKPNVDQIDGLSPSIAIDQKTISHNPRSIVGTMTEIYDYLRLLFARVGTPYCIYGHGKITTMTIQQMVLHLKSFLKEKNSLKIYSPIVVNKKGTFQTLFNKLKNEGFLKVVVDGKNLFLNEEILLEKNLKHTISILVDDFFYSLNQDTQKQLYSSLETATTYGNGVVHLHYYDFQKKLHKLIFSEKFSCSQCGFGLKEMEPRLFSFNTIHGSCQECKGIGSVLALDWQKLVPNQNLSINEGGILFYRSMINTNHRDWKLFKTMCDHFKIDRDQEISKIKKKEWKIILEGSEEKIKYSMYSKSGFNKWNFNHPFIGLKNIIQKRFSETAENSMHYRMTKKFLTHRQCDSCQGKRLNEIALTVKIDMLSISDVIKLSIANVLKWIQKLSFDSQKLQIITLVIKEIIQRLSYLKAVGLDYLTLDRHAQTLSGGESQRIRLATQIGSKLTGVLYVLDEPSIGLHPYDNQRLIATLKTMRDLGNTVIVVEHDEEMILNADFVVDIGPYGGQYGGKIIHCDTVSKLLKNSQSLTGKYLSHQEKIIVPLKRRRSNKDYLMLKNATMNNLKNINVKIPLHCLVGVTGISGSGKSTLVNDVLYKGIKKIIDPLFVGDVTSKQKILHALENIDRIIAITQEPIGKTSRSNPATYTSVFTDIRFLFANTLEAKKRGYQIGRFSFNVYGGRCEKCHGDGVIFHSMLFLPDVYVKCEACFGKRYNEETLQIKFKGKSIADILEMEINEALVFFENYQKISRKLKVLQDVGLGYLKIGQPSPQLSGGEAQRIKLATYLQKKPTGKTLYLLDEPTTGLHPYDIDKLIKLLNRLVDRGESVLLIEHNLDVIKSCDYLIDLGPFGGEHGGNVVATGTPEEISENRQSLTGKFLKKVLQKD